MSRGTLRRSARAICVVAALLLLAGLAPAQADAKRNPYDNPLTVQIPGDGVVESCADPTVIRGQGGDPNWYAYCTTDPLNGADRDASGAFNFHLIPILRSTDLVNWTYVGDAFA